MTNIEYLLERYYCAYNVSGTLSFFGIKDRRREESTEEYYRKRLARKGITDLEHLEQLSDYEVCEALGMMDIDRVHKDRKREIKRLSDFISL